MGLETATNINELVVTNPVGMTDDAKEGDNHLRLIKTVLKAVFPGFAGAIARTLAKSGAYTVLAADNSVMFNCTGTWTLSLTAAATLGNQHFFFVRNSGTGVITVDPDGSELINGVATVTIPAGTNAIMFCTGTAFLAILLPAVAAVNTWGESQTWSKQQYFVRQTLSDASSISWDLDTQPEATVTLGGNRTLANPTNMKDGGSYTLIVKQDATGSRTLAFGSAYKWSYGSAPILTTTANAVDILSFTSDGSSMFGTMLEDMQ